MRLALAWALALLAGGGAQGGGVLLDDFTLTPSGTGARRLSRSRGESRHEKARSRRAVGWRVVRYGFLSITSCSSHSRM